MIIENKLFLQYIRHFLVDFADLMILEPSLLGPTLSESVRIHPSKKNVRKTSLIVVSNEPLVLVESC